jgi:hypothetical protein
MVEESARPEPETVTVEPTFPLVGFRVMADVTVKVALAEFEGELESVIVTVWRPAVEAGTVKVAPVKEPVLPVLVVPPRVTDTPSNLAVIVLEPPKPVPDTVTVEPTLPLVGDRVIDGVTLKVAEAVLELESVADTVWPSMVDAGTVKVQLNVP